MIDQLTFTWPSSEEYSHPNPRLTGAVPIAELIDVLEDDEDRGDLHINPQYIEVVPADELRDALTLMRSAAEKLIGQEGGAEPEVVGRKLKEFVDRLAK